MYKVFFVHNYNEKVSIRVILRFNINKLEDYLPNRVHTIRFVF